MRAARKGWPNRIVAVFQPHRYSRTKDLFNEFLSAFNDADKLILTEVYAAGEEKIEGASGEALYKGIKGYGHKDVAYVPETSKIPSYLESIVQPGDIVITLGAGDVWKAGVMFVESLKSRAGA